MNRKSFLKRSLLFTGALALSLKSSFAFSLFRSREIKGKVSSKGVGLKNVLVTDGFSIVQTNGDGEYFLATNPKAEFIYMTIPAGYEFPEERNIARFYHSLKTSTDFNFSLRKLSGNDDEHNFIIWADPQVRNAEDVRQMMETSVPDVKALVRSFGKEQLIHGIGVGDLVWDDLSFFSSYDKAVAAMGIPFFQALGNHDQNYREGGDETSDRTFKENYGPTYYSFNRGKAHYIVLDDVRYLGVERTYDGYISEQQLSWLTEDLSHVGKDMLVIICAHIPVHNSVKNNADLYRIVESFKNVHIMSGHTHYNHNVIRNNVYEHNHGTVCGAWWTGPFCEDGAPRGYGVYKVKGNNLQWYYKSTGEPATKQFNLYLDNLNNQKRLLANVWNYDPDWKVEYFLDGQAMGAMERQKAYDPMTLSLYKGDKFPKRRPFAEPRLTEHIFLARFKPGVKVVEVVATDRFGKIYTEKINVS